MSNPISESSNLHRTVVSLPTANNLQNSLQNNLPSNLQATNLQANNAPNLMTSESINSQNYAVLPQQLQPPAIQHLSPEFLYDFGQKPNGYSMDSMDSLRNLNGLQSLSLTSLTPLLLLSSLGTLSSKAHAGSPLMTPTVSHGFLKGLTSYLSSYLPSSPRQRKRQIDRNLPMLTSTNPYSSFKKMSPLEPFAPFAPLQPLASQPKPSISAYEASFKKYAYFNRKKPIEYTKPKWAEKMTLKKPSYNMKKNKNQIKYSKLMNETGFVNRPNMTNNPERSNNKSPKRTSPPAKYSEPDKFANERLNKPVESKESGHQSSQSTSNADDESASRSADQPDNKQNEKDKLNEKKSSNENLNEKLSEDTNPATEEHRDAIELTSNQPQTDNLEDVAEKMYR